MTPRPGSRFLTLPFWILAALGVALGVGLWLGALNALYRDVRYTLAFILQIWFFASPIVFPSSSSTASAVVFALNPMVGVIDGFRWAPVGRSAAAGRRPRLASVSGSCCSSAASCSSGAPASNRRPDLMVRRGHRVRGPRQALPHRRGPARYATLRDVHRSRGPRQPEQRRDFWALRDVTSRCDAARSSASSAATAPARARCSSSSPDHRARPSGRVAIDGRAAALLEVGTGFHPELTGRENVFLNGVDPRHAARARSRAKLRRDRRLRRGRAVPRHAGEALLERHVRAARVRRRRPPRARDPARRRGARGRRRRVPAASASGRCRRSAAAAARSSS